MSQSAFDHLLQKYLSGECTEEEEKAVLEWYQQLVESSDLHLSEAERTKIEARLWNDIRTNTVQEQQPLPMPVRAVRMKKQTWWRVAAAACVLGLVLTGVWFFNKTQSGPAAVAENNSAPQYRQFRNETNSDKQLVLPDSSVILLTPGASVEYPATFDGLTREVRLKGSAFFTVTRKPDQRFKVYLNSGLTTEVIGTSFNITQHKQSSSIEVAVITGKVRVFEELQEKATSLTNDSNGVILTPNKKVMYYSTTRKFVTGLVDNPRSLSSVSSSVTHEKIVAHPFIFDEEPLDTVLAVLSKEYGISITAENEQSGQVHFTGNISKYDLHKQLDIICQSTQSVYRIEGTSIILKVKQ